MGAIAELLGAVGVILSLAYLATQIRQNTRQLGEHGRELRIAALEAISNSFSRLRDPIIRDPELAALWLRGLDDYGALEVVEKVRVGGLMQELFFAHQNTWSRFQEGATTEAAWLDHRRSIAINLRNPGIRTWWSATRPIFADKFEEVVEALIRENEQRANDPTHPSKASH